MMLQLTYISTSRNVDRTGLDAILAASRRNNGRDDITGLLLFNGKRFLQALEGPQQLVEIAYERIRIDTRHRAPVILSTRHVESRQFGHWNMAFEQAPTTGGERSLTETVDDLIAGLTDPNIRALFAGYVRLQTAA